MDIDQRDEIGKVAMAMETTRRDLRGLVGDIARSTGALQEDSGAVGGATGEVERGFGIVKRGLVGLAEEASHSTETARSIDDGARRMSAGVDHVARSMGAMSKVVSEVADACRSELVESDRAQEHVRATLEAMAELRDSAGRVEALVQQIHSILKHTKLLALNATIEAVRAGEVGKGFAVVAQEVKQLATDTGEATSEIDRRMKEMVHVVGVVDERSRMVAEAMDRIHGSSRGIASTMEEQASVVGAVASRVAEANEEASRIAGLVGQLAEAMSRMDGQAAGLVASAGVTEKSTAILGDASKRLDATSRALRDLVARFRLEP
jgi:methyl-accepting chemotaxis protein